jgi:hypothetical protein
MKKFVFAMLMTVATLSASARPATPAEKATEPGEGDQVGTCVWECSANGTIYQKPSLCAAACSTTCEPLCW